MGSGMGVGTNSSSGKGNSDTGGHFNSESDDEQLVVDERKQKRMLSNRESARRSRLRKQQHLDELRAHVAHLRAENTHMLNRFSLASQQYAQLSNENRVLQSHVVDLTQRLQRLQQTTEAHHPGAASHLDQAPLHLSLRSGGCEDEAWQQPLITP
jgi:replicative DNA helicase